MKTAAEREYEIFRIVVAYYNGGYDQETRDKITAAIEAAVAEERARHEGLARHDGHGEPCYYCEEPCNGLAGNPYLWPIPLCHEDEPGVVKFHHIGCVSKRLHDAAEERARYRWLRKNSIAPLTWKVAIRFPGGGSNIRAPKTEAEVDSWIDEEMRREAPG